MIVLVCGGRNYANAERVGNILDNLTITMIVEGGAGGADGLARQWAYANDVEVRTFPANWGKYGRSAGPRRNRQMLAEGKPDLVVAFPGGRGTADMVRVAKEAGVQVIQPYG